MNSKVRRRIEIITAMMLMLACAVMNSFASSTSDAVPDLPGGPYSLTVELKSTNPDGTVTGIRGAGLSAYQVATLEVKNTAANYSAKKEFSDVGVVFEDMTASESNQAAKAFAELVRSKNLFSIGDSKNTDGAGTAVFTNLSAGIYLIMLDGYDSSDARYTEMDPFLALVPGIERSESGNLWISNVTVAPKIAISPKDYLEVDPPVVKKVEGNDNSEELFTFEIEADDITNPMPVGTRNGKKQITIKGSGKTEFGPWRYTEPGTYRYTIREIPGSNKNYKYDSRIYHLTDKVSYSGNRLQLEQILVDEDGNTYDDGTAVFEFVNKYNKPGIPGYPKTGDDSPVLVWLIILTVSILSVIALVAKRDKSQ